MKKLIIAIALTVVFSSVPVAHSYSQLAIIEAIKGAVKKVIKAIDLKVQRLQNKTIWLQNAQKELENTMSKLKLDQIGDWTEKQKALYSEYFEELRKVKSLIAYYQRIRDIIRKQEQIVSEYRRAWSLVRNDKNFTAAEIDYMGKVYSGIIDESVKNLDEVALVINSFRTTMSDAKRIEIMDAAAQRIEQNAGDLRQFNRQNGLLSMQRAGSLSEAGRIKAIYGIK